MKVIVKKEKLMKCIQKAQSIIEKRTTMPIISNVLIETEDKMIIKATNLDVSIIVKEDVEIIDKGKICVPAKTLFEIVKSLPESDVTIEQSDTNAVIKCGRTNFKLFTYPPEDYPKFKTAEKNKKFVVNTNKFFESIKKVEYTIYPDESRENLNGVFIQKINDKLRFVASDSYRLAYNEFNYTNEWEDVLIPKKTVNEMSKINTDSAVEEMTFYIGNNNTLTIEIGNTTIISTLKDAKFPNYKDVIPNNPFKLYINKSTILNTLKRISIISEENTKSVILNIDENKIIVKAINSEIGLADEEIDAKYEGTPFEICFNAKFLIEAIEPVEAETILIELKDSQSAAMVSGDECYRAVIMPIRL